jgi:hypothetical protein
MRILFLASAAAATLLTGFSGSALAQQRGGGGGGGGGGQQGGQPAPAATAAGQPTGSFQQSCRNVQVQGGAVSAECLDTQGRYRMSSIPYGGCRDGISNNNGVLFCNGATANAGAYVDNNNNNNNNNNRNNNNNNNNNRNNNAGAAAVGAFAGALLGNALGGDVYAPNARYPTYGDPHYGDPRYDSRYSQQGWGAGHRVGEWVWIRDRADWLNRQIDHDERDGALRRDEVRNLRQQLTDLINRENNYRRQGMANWMRTDLDRRFDQIAYRVQDAERIYVRDHRDRNNNDNRDRNNNNGGYGR